ncbi:MAG TPA: transcriptional regulator, partial [Campylobacterales bacterium]|nr:transcriptional regulator [Campylobacterales bacterium]
MVTIQNGTIEDFFDSAKKTAKQIDDKVTVAAKHTIWMETDDLLNILKAE